MAVLIIRVLASRNVNETGTFETETRNFETETAALETETKILETETGLEIGLETETETGLETETSLKTTMIRKFLYDLKETYTTTVLRTKQLEV